MKTVKKVRIASLAIIAFLFTNALMAQHSDTLRMLHRGKGLHPRMVGMEYGIPNLTSDQKTKIKAQRVAFGKEALPLTNQLAEKRAHLHTLQTAQAYDVNAVNATIDDIKKTESQLMKKQVASREEIRKLLNDEQKLAFDSKRGTRRGYGKINNWHKRGHRN